MKPEVEILDPATLIPDLRGEVEKHQIRVGTPLTKDGKGLCKMTGPFFIPENVLQEIEAPIGPTPAVLIVPARFSKQAQRDVANRIRGFYHGMELATRRLAESA